MFCIVFFISVKGQIIDAEDAINEGDEALKNDRFYEAINKYFAAEAFEPTMKAQVKEKVKIAFDRIMALRNKADTLRQEAENAKIATQRSLAQTQKIISAFYFYDEQFALAYKNNKYGFINKDGDTVIGYKYEEARPFDYTGLSRVKRNNQLYLLDNKKTEYKLVIGINNLSATSEALDLSNLQLGKFPENITAYSNLRILLLNGNEIDQLPASIDSLNRLRRLFIYNNNLSGLPFEIGSFDSLVTLDASVNKLLRLPGSVSKLTNLEELVLYDNNLSDLPAGMGNLQKLFFLDVSNNLLQSLPSGIDSLGALRILALSQNQFKGFPPSIKSLPELIMLDLSGNLIDSIPAWIEGLHKLTHLHVWDCGLDSLPHQITGLDSLKVLVAGNNQLTSLPENMDNLSKLEELVLYGNQFTTIPPALGSMKELVKLDLRNNPGLDADEIRAAFKNYLKKEIKYSSAVYPQITDTSQLLIKVDVLPWLRLVSLDTAQARKLEKLDLSNQDLAVIPGEVFTLENLEILNLSGNNLSVIPAAEIGRLKKLKALYLLNNQLPEEEKEKIRAALPVGCMVHFDNAP